MALIEKIQHVIIYSFFCFFIHFIEVDEVARPMHFIVKVLWSTQDIVVHSIWLNFQSNEVVVPDSVVRDHKEAHEDFTEPKLYLFVKIGSVRFHSSAAKILALFPPVEAYKQLDSY